MAAVLATSTTIWWAWITVSLPRPVEWEEWLMVHPAAAVITCGYYWRAIGSPSSVWCRVIWGCSLLAQGALLTIFASVSLLLDADNIARALALWFAASTTMSLVGLLLDPGRQPEDSPDKVAVDRPAVDR